MMRRSPNSSGNLAVNRVWRARRWEAIQQGQELSFAKTEWCLPATSRKLSAVRSVGKVETDSRPLPPKRQVKPWPCSDQKARKTTNMTWFTKLQNLHPRFKSGRRLQIPFKSARFVP